RGAGLYDVGEGAGPSKTLIEWRDLMWYDFANDQTRLEGDVNLKHFSGLELQRRFGGMTETTQPGRAMFLTCDVLTVDFLDRDERNRSREAGRMGGLSAAGLRQFQAKGDVKLNDAGIGLWLSALRVVYEKDRNLLAIHGSDRQPARIVQQRQGELPTDIQARRFYYNTKTGGIEASGPTFRGR
ncbi:MAG: hypothetical protein IID43_07225, partial [Planctomycetes bacterium]|nr:hypothetical protein [Planctomycetota bacterium]